MAEFEYMSGYGVSLGKLAPLIKEEISEEYYNSSDIDELVDLIDDDNILCFIGEEDNYLYILDRPPYAPLFSSIEEIDEYFFNKLKPLLKTTVTLEDLSKLLDDIFDCNCYF